MGVEELSNGIRNWPGGARFAGGKGSSAALIEMRAGHSVAVANGSDIDHGNTLRSRSVTAESPMIRAHDPIQLIHDRPSEQIAIRRNRLIA